MSASLRIDLARLDICTIQLFESNTNMIIEDLVTCLKKLFGFTISKLKEPKNKNWPSCQSKRKSVINKCLPSQALTANEILMLYHIQPPVHQ